MVFRIWRIGGCVCVYVCLAKCREVGCAGRCVKGGKFMRSSGFCNALVGICG